MEKVLLAIPAELASDIAEALGHLARRRWLDGGVFPPALSRLRGELEEHGRRWAAAADATPCSAGRTGLPHGAGGE